MCTTPVTPCRACRTASRSSTEPSTKRAPSGSREASPVLRSSSATTSWPSCTIARTTCAPMYPAPPVTSQLMGATLAGSVGAELHVLDLHAHLLDLQQHPVTQVRRGLLLARAGDQLH